jgi:lysophospholipase L1-like esterase
VKRLLLIVGMLLCVGLAGAQAAQDFFFKPTDDPIVFLGDSITQQRMYTAYIEAYILTRFPDWKLHFRNVGWNGDTSWFDVRDGIDHGLARDVFPLHPQAMTMEFGMNDARKGAHALPLYHDSLTEQITDLEAKGIRVALVSPTPEQRDESNEPVGSVYNRLLDRFCAVAQKTAQEQKIPFVDQFHPFVDTYTAAQTDCLSNFILVPDHVHPNWAGHLIMAYQILKQLHAPALVSRVVLDATGKRAAATERCEVTGLQFRPGRIAFTRKDESLPMPVRPESEILFSVPGFNFSADLNQYTLAVTGLTAGDYDVHLDGEWLGTFSSRELTCGVNLSNNCGCIQRQSLRLLDKVWEKNNTYMRRWRSVQLGTPLPKQTPAAFAAWQQKELARDDALIARQEAEIDALRHPGPHQWLVTRVTNESPAPTEIASAWENGNG